MLCWEKSSTFCVQSIDIDPQQSGVTVTDTDTWNTFEYKTSKGY